MFLQDKSSGFLMQDKATDPRAQDTEVSFKMRFHIFPLPFLPTISTFPQAHDTNIKSLLANLLDNQMIHPKCCYQIPLGVLPPLLFLQLPILTQEFSHPGCCFSLFQRPPHHLKTKQKPSEKCCWCNWTVQTRSFVSNNPVLITSMKEEKKLCRTITWDELSLQLSLETTVE